MPYALQRPLVARSSHIASLLTFALLAGSQAGCRPAAPGLGTVLPSEGCSVGAAEGRPETGEHLERALSVAGVRRTYVIDIPSSAGTKSPMPLVLYFHGLGHSGAALARSSDLRPLARKAGFVVVYPDGLPVSLDLGDRVLDGPGWEIQQRQGNREIAFVAQLLDDLERSLCIDRARIYATGFSNGGYLSHLLGCTMADRLAAIAPVGGGWIPGECAPSRAMPVLIHHGRKDPIVSVEAARRARDRWIALDQCSSAGSGAGGETDSGTDSDGCEAHTQCGSDAVVRYCESDDGHRWPRGATERIWAFFRAHSLSLRDAR